MLVGRESEQQQIDRLAAGARIGEAGVLSIVGEPGIGKSSLLHFAETRLHGFNLLRAIGTEAEREIPFAGLLSALRPALPYLDGVPRPQADALLAALALGPGSPGDRFAIGAATLSLICRYAEQRPVAVLVDDLHWMDRPSAEALLFAARRLTADPVLFLTAIRAGEGDGMLAGLPTLSLSGLGLEASRDLVVRGAGVALTDEHLQRLHRATAGNPLAMQQLAGNEELLAMPPGTPAPLPAALATAFTQQIRLLAPAARRALLVAVVADGDGYLTGAACEHLGLDAAELAAAADAGLVRTTSSRLDFRHPLLRSAVYADAEPGERRTAHRAVAEALPVSDTDRRAWHLSETVVSHDAHIAGLLADTAARAALRGAYSVASTAFERAARISPHATEQIDRLIDAATTAWSAGTVRRASSLLAELDRRSLPDVSAAATLQLKAAIAARTGSLIEACTILERAAAQTSDPDSEVRLLADAVHATFYLADTARVSRLAHRLGDALGAAEAADARAVGLIATGMARILLGRGGEGQIRAAVPLLSRTERRQLHWLMLAPLFLRDVDTGADLRTDVAASRSEVGIGALPALLFHMARDQATGDSWARAAANYTEAIRLARETGQSTELAMSLAGLACLESRQGLPEACRTHADEALSICRHRQIRLGELWVLSALGDLELCLGNPAAALDPLQELQALLLQLGLGDPDLSPAPEQVDALLRIDRGEEAAEIAADYLEAATVKQRPWALARAHRAAALTAAPDEFDAQFLDALDLHEQTPDCFETARTQLAYGSRLRRAGRRVDARTRLRAAMTNFVDLGATLWADRAAAELNATGEKVRRRDPGGIAALTPQELQVSLLLSEGQTTREVAAALFLSPKTVEYHLRKVYTKLGVHSRAELARLLPR